MLIMISNSKIVTVRYASVKLACQEKDPLACAEGSFSMRAVWYAVGTSLVNF